jgi:hypothetical protein
MKHQDNLNPREPATSSNTVWNTDGDGLGLFDEYRHCTDPGETDTDNDGVSDLDELTPRAVGGPGLLAASGQGDPFSCSGDASGSHSERWNMEVAECGAGKVTFSGNLSGFKGTLAFPGGYNTTYNWCAFWRGKIRITAAGAYTFSTVSDDHSMLYIDRAVVVNNNGSHGMTTKTGMVTLDPSLHDIAILYAQGGGGSGLTASLLAPGESAAVPIPTRCWSPTLKTCPPTRSPWIRSTSSAEPARARWRWAARGFCGSGRSR